MNQLHNYARQLLSLKRNKEAFDAFKKNYDRHPNQFTTNVGMMRGYSGLGNYKKALEYAEKAQPQAPDKPNKDNVERMIGQLKEGKDVNVQ
jgi:tetratricopeptide (TPR) repeat protein